MRPRNFWSSKLNFYWTFLNEEFEDSDDEFTDEEAYILDAKYKGISPKEVADQQKNLTEDKRRKLEKVLEKFPMLFDGKLSHYPHEKFHLDLEPGSKPVHSRPYSVPKLHKEAFKKELQHLEIGRAHV